MSKTVEVDYGSAPHEVVSALNTILVLHGLEIITHDTGDDQYRFSVGGKASAVPDLVEACLNAVAMIDNCAGIPTQPDSLPQMIRESLLRALAKATKGEAV